MNNIVTEVIKEMCSLYEYEVLATGGKYIYYRDMQLDEKRVEETRSFLESFIYDYEQRLFGHQHDKETIDSYLEDIMKLNKALEVLGGKQ